MIRIREVDHIVLRVRELQPMLDFYCSVLGCSVERQQDEIGLVQLRAGRSLLGLIPADSPLGRAGSASPAASARNLDHLCLRVEPFDRAAVVSHLEAHGVRFGEIRPRFGAEGEGISNYLWDPEDNLVELKGELAA